MWGHGWWISAEDQKLRTYRSYFNAIRTSKEADSFIQLYQQYDPEGLVAKAREQGSRYCLPSPRQLSKKLWSKID